MVGVLRTHSHFKSESFKYREKNLPPAGKTWLSRSFTSGFIDPQIISYWRLNSLRELQGGEANVRKYVDFLHLTPGLCKSNLASWRRGRCFSSFYFLTSLLSLCQYSESIINCKNVAQGCWCSICNYPLIIGQNNQLLSI